MHYSIHTKPLQTIVIYYTTHSGPDVSGHMGVSVRNFYIVSVSRPVSGGLKSVSIVEYYLKNARYL